MAKHKDRPDSTGSSVPPGPTTPQQVDHEQLRRDARAFREELRRRLEVFDHVPPETMSFVVR